MSTLLFRRTSHGDLYPINLASILKPGMRVWDPSYSLSKDPEIWEKVQQDAVLAGTIERALKAIAGPEWSLRPASDDPADVALASILEGLIQRIPRFTESRRNLAEARFLGSAFAQITGRIGIGTFHDRKPRRWWIPGRLIDIDRRRLHAIVQEDKPGEPVRLRWKLHSPSRKAWELLRDDFPLVRHVYADSESRLGYGRGIMDSLYFAYYIRSVIYKDGLQGLRRWAQGLLVGKVGLEAAGRIDQTNEDIRNELRDRLLSMIGDNVLVIGEGDNVEVVTGGMEGHQIVSAMLDRVEREIITLVEGSPASTMDGAGGGSRSLGAEHGAREHAGHRYERESLSESMGTLVKACKVFNLKTLAEIDRALPSANLPIFEVRDVPIEDPARNAETAGKILEVAPVAKAEFYERVGWRQPKEGEEVIEPKSAQQQPPGMPPGMGPPGAEGADPTTARNGADEDNVNQGPPQPGQPPQQQREPFPAAAVFREEIARLRADMEHAIRGMALDVRGSRTQPGGDSPAPRHDVEAILRLTASGDLEHDAATAILQEVFGLPLAKASRLVELVQASRRTARATVKSVERDEEGRIVRVVEKAVDDGRDD